MIKTGLKTMLQKTIPQLLEEILSQIQEVNSKINEREKAVMPNITDKKIEYRDANDKPASKEAPAKKKPGRKAN